MYGARHPAAFRGITGYPWWISTVPGTSHANRARSFASLRAPALFAPSFRVHVRSQMLPLHNRSGSRRRCLAYSSSSERERRLGLVLRVAGLRSRRSSGKRCHMTPFNPLVVAIDRKSSKVERANNGFKGGRVFCRGIVSDNFTRIN